MSSYRDDANQLRKEARWTFWRFLPLAITIIVVLSVGGFVLHSTGLIGKTVVEREVFENSFQYSEAIEAQIATDEATLAEIERKLLNPELETSTRHNLEAQASAARIRISTTKARRDQ